MLYFFVSLPCSAMGSPQVMGFAQPGRTLCSNCTTVISTESKTIDTGNGWREGGLRKSNGCEPISALTAGRGEQDYQGQSKGTALNCSIRGVCTSFSLLGPKAAGTPLATKQNRGLQYLEALTDEP